jgi:hypothetical protein
MTAEERERLAVAIEAECDRIRDDPDYIDFLVDPTEVNYFSGLKRAARLVREWPVEGQLSKVSVPGQTPPEVGSLTARDL